MPANDAWKRGISVMQSLTRDAYQIRSANIATVESGAIVTIVAENQLTLKRLWDSFFDRGYSIVIVTDLIVRITLDDDDNSPRPRDNAAVTLCVNADPTTPCLGAARVNQHD